MLNRMFVVSSATLTSTGTAVSRAIPFDASCRKLPTQIVVKATNQGAYVRLSSTGVAATNADVLVQAGDHVVLSVQGHSYVSVLSDGASSTVSIGALSTGVWGDAIPLTTGYTVLPAAGTPSYTATRTVLDSAGTSYSVPATVLDSAGTSYTPI